MQLFYWLNSLAGRSAAFDAAMRFFYVCAVPLLWTALLALLLIPRRAAPASQPRDESNRGEIAHVAILLSAVCVVAGCALSMMAATFYARHWLEMENLSSRPFITHWVNLLVVEPNDNSFPCPETILAGGAATLLWAASPANSRWNAGAWGWGVAIGLALARVFCGTNYPIDVFAGLVLGFAWAALPLALGRVSLWLPSLGGVRWRWKLLPQAALSGLAMIGVVAFAASTFGHGVRPMAIPKSVSAGEATLHEGEGGAVSTDVEADVPRASEHYGRQPMIEAHLRRAVAALRLPYELSDLEVAQIRVGQSNFRVAQARFEVVQRAPNERRRVAQMAVALVKTCFAHDASLQNVDVTGLVSRRVAPIQGTSAQVERKAIPVFTASVQRRNLLLTSGPVWAIAPGTDAGLWLRARSRLYIDPKILPATPEPTPTAKPTPIPKPTPKANRPRIIPPLSTKPTTPKAAKPRISKPKVATPKTPLSKAPPKINPPRPTNVAPKRAPQVRPNSARVTTRKPPYRRKWRARRGTSTRRRRSWTR